MADSIIAPGRVGGRLRAVIKHSLATLLATTALGVVVAHAVDGNWVGATSDWTDPANWSSPTVPDGTATFGNTGSAAVDNNNGIITIGTVLFNGTAQAYTVTVGNPFIINGTGIINNSGNTQNFAVTSGNNLVFQQNSTASGGTGAVIITNATGGTVNFIQNSTAGTVTLINNSFVTFEDFASAGTSQITNNANGQIDFFINATAAGSTINNAASATLNFHNNTTAGTSSIANSGSLNFDGSATGGNSTITTNNLATTTFSGTASGGNARFITNAGGTVDFSGLTNGGTTAGSIEGAGNYVLGASTLTTGSLNTSTQVDGVISGTGGGLTKVGTGTLTLTGGNTYTGATTVSAGTLALSGFADISSSSVVTVNATFDVSGMNPGVPAVINTLAGNSSGIVNLGNTNLFIVNGSTEFAGVIQGTGGSEVFGGTQTLSGVNTYTNATQIDAGATLALKGSGSIASSASVTFTPGAGGTFDISQTTSGATANALVSATSGSFVSLGSKTLTITTGSLYGGVIQDGGIAGGTGGNLVIANGALQQLSGINTYTGTTTIAAGGELDLTNGGSDGSIATSSNVIANGIFDISGLAAGTSIKSLSGSGNVNLGADTLTITGGNSTFAGIIGDGGAGGGLTMAGGAETLTGANTYTGATTVNGGRLQVDGSIVSASTVNAGGTLAGTGTVGNVAVTGGTLAPGHAGAIGTLAVNGSLSFTAASTYMVHVSSSTASLTNVTGAATLGGATVSAIFGSGSVKKQYTILTAAGGLGGTTFNPAVVSNMPTINATLSYVGNNVFLNIGVDFTPSGGSLSVNQQNVANALASFFNSNGSIPAAFVALTPSGLTTASGELGTGIIQSAINADGQFLNLMLDPTIAGRSSGFTKAGSVAQFAESDDADAYASMRPATAREREAFAMATKAPLLSAQPINRWSVWTAGYGGSAQVGGNAAVGSQDLTARVWGGAAGADYRISMDTLVGFALGGGGLNYSLANAMGTGSADLFQAGAYGRHNFGPAYISAALAYGWHDVTTNRTVIGADQLQGRFKADTFSARFEGGYRFTTPLVGITPYAAAQVTNFNLPNYSEVSLNGGGLFALNYASQSLTDTRSELGLRTDKSYAMQNGVLTLRGRAAWAHDYNPSRAVTALFQTLPGTSFVVNGARVDADSALVSASAEMKWLNGFSIAGTFDGEFSGNVTSYSGKGVFKYSW
ncbi:MULTISPECIES: autotransporter outer membrane beta-barrel domain-containing protein [Bradyrhizobium]|uniref:autotransporter outer membrane beta-barrel domain-containing protein n=1 Tax=Bradyrhizobium TaxID=374 RepID=UPI001EDA0E58|nr:autotransporter outer membrane beta-barrel domain-containing protein [Bradyrhizobium zhengyangense]MCG2643587.1 autotransporter domain-containing protein [Bradyrhizobium zhengyangense]